MQTRYSCILHWFTSFRDNDQLKMKIAKLMKDPDDAMFNMITSSLSERRHLWNVYEQTSEIDQVILEAVMKGKICRVQVNITKGYKFTRRVFLHLFQSVILPKSLISKSYLCYSEQFL